MLCGHEDVICLYCRNVFLCFISSSEYSTVRRNPYNLYCDEDRFQYIIPKFPHCFFHFIYFIS